MNISAPFIHRPIATTLIALAIAFSGILSFNLMPVSIIPQIEFPTINVQATLPGASPNVMATAVATPLERQLGRIAGLTEMTSSSNLGSTRIAVQFDLARDINGAARDVQAAINASLGQLPNNLPSNPTYRIVNPADAPIMVISLTSDVLSTGQMYDVASTILQQRLSQVEGVGQVNIGGSSLPAVRIELNPTILNNYGISLEEVRTFLTSANVNRPKGNTQNHLHTVEIGANDQLFKAQDYRSLIVTYRNGSPVKLSDLGTVIDSVEDLHNAGLADGKDAVILVIYKSPGANIIDAVERIKNSISQLKNVIPASIELTTIMDRTTTIRASLKDVEITLVFAILLVVLVIYYFLGSFRAAFIPSIVVPLSLLGTFGCMYLLGYSLDNLSLMALTISTGFVVDDAVVVLENISRHIEKGMRPLQAALQGAQEVGFTVVSMSTSLIAVFTPILFMGGIIGRLFREFAMTMSLAILVSLIVALTITPMMSAYFLKHTTPRPPSRLIKGMDHFYRRTLGWALRHQKLMVWVTFLTIVINIFLFLIVPKGFFPQQDTGRLIGSIQARQDASFQSIKQQLLEYVRIVQENPNVAHFAGFIGGNTSIGRSGTLFINLKPHDQRPLSGEAVISQLREKFAAVHGANLYLNPSQDLVIGGRQGNAQYQYTLSAYDLKDLNEWAPRVLEKLSQIPGIADVNTDQLNQGLQVYLTIDRDTASRLGVTIDQIDNVLYDAFGQRQVSTMYTPINQYHVVMEVEPKYWQSPQTLQDIYVIGSQGQKIPLSTFAKFSPSSTLLLVNHQGQFPCATLSFNLLPGYVLGDAVDKINQAMEEIQLPKDRIRGSFQGSAQAFQSSLANEPYIILGALIAIYIVLGILYESTIHPLTILSTLPSAGVGAILALLLTRTELSIIALIGIILLIGIVKKNGIMMIDFALHIKRSQGKSSIVSIYQACLKRFRPIMMTTLAAMFGALPLALGTGVGSEFRQPLGIAIIGGLLISQLLTLYTTPVIYLLLEKFSYWCQQHWFIRGSLTPSTSTVQT